MSSAIEATAGVAEQVIIEQPSFEEQLNEFMQFIFMGLLVLI